MKTAWKIVVSFFGVGYLRPFSATWGSLAAGLLLYFFWPSLSFDTKAVIIVMTFFLGAYLGGKVESLEKLHDPHFIVIDEFVGMMVSTFFLSQIWWHWLSAFFLFRFFDIIKPWPASSIDRNKGGSAIMMDDVIAGAYTLMVSWIVIQIPS